MPKQDASLIKYKEKGKTYFSKIKLQPKNVEVAYEGQQIDNDTVSFLNEHQVSYDDESGYLISYSGNQISLWEHTSELK